MNIRTIAIDDYQKLIEFWKKNYFVNEIDSLDNFKLFLEKNPGLSLLTQNNEGIIGTVLGSFDGRRGYIQKLVVRKDLRGQGIGKQLIRKVIEKLKAVGATYIPLNVEENKVSFYDKCGLKKTTQISMNKNI